MTHLIVPITAPVVLNSSVLAYKVHVHMRIAAFPLAFPFLQFHTLLASPGFSTFAGSSTFGHCH